MKETNYTYTHTGADYLNDGPPRAEFTPDGETAFVPVNGKSGLLVGAALVGVGLVSILAPGAAGISLATLLTGGLGVYGIAQIIAFARLPWDKRSGWTLANGIAMTLLSVVTLWMALTTPLGMGSMIASLASVAAFFGLLAGVGQLFQYTTLRRTKSPGAGWVLASGIVNLLVGLVVMAAPVAGWFALSTLWGTFLAGSGVAVLAESCSGHRGLRAVEYPLPAPRRKPQIKERLSEVRKGVLFCLHLPVAAGHSPHPALKALCRARQRVPGSGQGPCVLKARTAAQGALQSVSEGAGIYAKSPEPCWLGALGYVWFTPRWGPARGR